MKNQLGNTLKQRARGKARLAARLGFYTGLFCSAASARAGWAPIAPGEALVLSGADYQTPVGAIVAREAIPFSAPYHPDGSFVDFSGSATGELDEEVSRDPKTGQLSFLYAIDLDNEGFTSASQGSQLTVSGFAAYQTLVAGQLQFAPAAAVFRASDGSNLRLYNNSPGLGGAPELAVRTNATGFDAGGTVSFALADEFRVNGPVGEELDVVWGNVTLKNAYRPTGVALNGTGSGGTTTAAAVPLPPAFYTGLGVLAACGVIFLGRRLAG